MIRLLGRKKLFDLLKAEGLTPAVKMEMRRIIRTSHLKKKDIIESVHKAVDYWDDMREYDKSAKLERYFFGNQVFSEPNEEKEVTFREEYSDMVGTDLDDEPPAKSDFEKEFHEDKSSVIVSDADEEDEELDEEEFFFDDDIVYEGFFSRAKRHEARDYLIMGEDEYDAKRNRNLFKVAFLIGLPFSVVVYFAVLGLIQYFSIPLPFDTIWLSPLIGLFALAIAFFIYIDLEPKELLWSYERVMGLSYMLTITYGCVILMGGVIAFYLFKDNEFNLDKRFYFKLDEFEAQVEQFPFDAEARMRLAYAYMSNDDQQKALDEIKHALKIAPDLAAAEDLYKAIISTYIINKEAVIHFSNGMLYWFIEQDESAMSEFEEAVKLYPKFGEAHYYIASIYYNKRNYDTAWKHAVEAKRAGNERVATLIDELQRYFTMPPM